MSGGAEHPRLSKLMAARGICSRREADRFIAQGLVLVDGAPAAELGVRVGEGQRITLAAEAQQAQRELETVLLHKPPGYVSGTPEPGCRAAMMLITDANWGGGGEPAAPDRHGLAPAGRLDMDSVGLLVFTQDGRVARRLIGPQSRLEKEYRVRVGGALTAAKLARLRHGLWLDGKPLRPAQVAAGADGELRFILTEGRKRQIRRMCEQLELRVEWLMRVRIGGVVLGDLPTGKWRRLLPGEGF